MASERVKEIIKKAGGTNVVKAALGITPAAISNWQKIPSEHLLKIAEMTGLTPGEIRPDMAPKQAAAE